MVTISTQCQIEVENVFGPQVTECYDNFDFTLLFEESILYLGPLLLAISLMLIRSWQLKAQGTVIRKSILSVLKQVSAASKRSIPAEAWLHADE